MRLLIGVAVTAGAALAFWLARGPRRLGGLARFLADEPWRKDPPRPTIH